MSQSDIRPYAEQLAWAVSTGRDSPVMFGYGYLDLERPAHFGGYTVCSFKTREEAKEFCRSVKKTSDRPWGWPTARVVRVKITVEKI